MGLWLTVAGLCGSALVMSNHYHKASDSAAKIAKVLIFTKTSVVGAYLTMRYVGGHLQGRPITGGDYGGFPYEPVPYPQPANAWIYMCLVVLLSMLGVAVQMQLTHKDHCGLGEDKANDEGK